MQIVVAVADRGNWVRWLIVLDEMVLSLYAGEVRASMESGRALRNKAAYKGSRKISEALRSRFMAG